VRTAETTHHSKIWIEQVLAMTSIRNTIVNYLL
jgi:hypothetical protein